MNACPTCGHVTRASRKPAIVTLPERADLDRMHESRELNKDAYFAACKSIGFRDDLRFLIRVAGDNMPSNLLIEASELLAELETRASKPADGKAINSIRDRYRASLHSLTIPRVSWLRSDEYDWAGKAAA